MKEAALRKALPQRKASPGQAPEDTDQKILKAFNAHDVAISITRICNLSVDDLIILVNNKNNSGIDVAHARILLKAIELSDENKMEYLMNRSAGKVKEKVDLHVDGNFNVHNFVVDYIASLEEAKKS